MEKRLQFKKRTRLGTEMEVDAGVSQGESAEMKSPTRKVIRVESEVTQDYVCEMLTISPEEAEE